MKNIETIIAEAGVELTDEQKQKINDGVKENYKTVADYQKQKEKIDSLEKTVETAQETIKKFEGANPEELKKKVEELTKTIESNKADYEAKIADRDFTDMVDKAITSANGKNNKAIKALLDIEGLKSSKNQQKEIEAALKELAEAEDSKMLFGEPEPQNLGKGNPIGTVTKDNGAGLTGVEKAFYERTGVKL